MKLSKDGQSVTGSKIKIKCNCLGISGGWTPAVHLFTQSGGKLKFDNEDNILLYCRSGRRSLIGAEILVKNGYKKIYDLKGGVISIDKSILDFNPLDN